MNTYTVINKKTGEIVGTYKTRNGAFYAIDKYDNIYGASVHTIYREKGDK